MVQMGGGGVGGWGVNDVRCLLPTKVIMRRGCGRNATPG